MQEEILGCERAFGSQIENQEVQQIGQQLQPNYAGLYHGPMVPDFVTPIAFAEHSTPGAIGALVRRPQCRQAEDGAQTMAMIGTVLLGAAT